MGKTFLGNYETKREAQRAGASHKRTWGGRTSITVTKIGRPPRKRYLLWHSG